MDEVLTTMDYEVLLVLRVICLAIFASSDKVVIPCHIKFFGRTSGLGAKVSR